MRQRIPHAGWRLVSMAGVGLLMAGCLGGGRKKPAVEEASAKEQASGNLPASATGQDAGSAWRDMDQHVKRMDFWLKVAVPPVDDSEGGVVFRAYGYEITRLDYEMGLLDHLAGRPNTPALEEEYRGRLRAELMLLRWAEETGKSRDPRFRVQAREDLRVSLAAAAIEDDLARITVDDAELQRLYNERLGEFQPEEKVQVRIILVPTPEEADEILGRLRAGESFASLASARSQHQSREKLGLMDPFARGQYIKEFEDKAFALAPGEIGSVSTPAGTFIIEKVANIRAQSVPFAEVREKLRLELLEKKRAERREALLREAHDRVSRFEDGQ